MGKSSLAKQTTTLLAVPKSFTATALAFPDKCRKALELLDDVDDVKDMLAKADAYAIYAKKIQASTVESNAIQEGKLLIVARLADLNPPSPPGRGKKKGANAVAPFSKAHMKNFRKVSKHHDRIATARKEFDDAGQDLSLNQFIRYIGSDGLLATKFSGEVEWYTPKEYIEAARTVMGGIDLDPASNDFAQKTVKADQYFSAKDDAFQYEWTGRVFLNPPFKTSLITRFVDELCNCVLSRDVTQAVLLTNNNTDTGWWHQAARCCKCICFTKGRIKFYNKAGEFSAPTNGQTFFYFGNRTKTFMDTFKDFGLCLTP